jgi:hypothetical protein
MARLEDEDGIDAPFERAMRRAEREDRKQKRGYAVGALSRHAVDCTCRHCAVRSTRVIDEVFEATRAAVATECIADGWSPAQHARRSA